MKPRSTTTDAFGFSQRQRRVGEEVRHALAYWLQREGIENDQGDTISLTVTEVQVSPDLKNASAYVMPLAGMNRETVLQELNLRAGNLRHLVGQRVALKHTPKLRFHLDTTFDQAGRIDDLLRKPQVARDLHKATD